MIWDKLEPIVQRLEDNHSVEEWRRTLAKWENHIWHNHDAVDEKTSVLMVDANAVTIDRKPDLDALHNLLADHVQASISDLYLVSLFPYSAHPSDTPLSPRVRLYEDLGRFSNEFELMFEMSLDVYNEKQLDLLKETDAFIERLAQGATKIRVHIQSFRGMPEDSIKNVLALWHTILHHYKPNGQLILACEAVNCSAHVYFEVVDAICHFDLSSHTILAFAQGDATRLSDWARAIEAPPAEKTYFNFLSMAERDPFEKNLIDPSVEMLLAAHSILFSMQGIPSVDYRTLLGVTMPVDHDTLVQEMKTDPYRLQVFSGILSQLNVKRTNPAFSPYAEQRIIKQDSRLFAVERKAGNATVQLYTNVSEETVRIDVRGESLFTGEPVEKVDLAPYDYVWIRT